MAAYKDLIRRDLLNYCPASNLAFNEKIKGMLSRGEKVYHFGFGQAPFPIMTEIIEALQEFAGECNYEPVAGIPQFREAICKFHDRYDGLSYDPDQVVVAPGSKELIFLAMTVFNGDILVISPSWTTYKPQSRLAGRRAFDVTTRMEDQWRITPQILNQVIVDNNLTGNKMLIICSPDNPTGTSYNASHLKELATFCRQHNIIVIADEIYARLHFSDQHQSFPKFYPEGTVLSSGMSKWASAGGWRIGYHIYPKELGALHDAVKSAASHSYSCAPVPMQYAFSKAMLNESACSDYIKHTTRIMKNISEFCYRELIAAGLSALQPTGGYYIFPCFDNIKAQLAARGITTGEHMCQVIFEEARVALMSGGPAFLRPATELTVRLCFVTFDGEVALAASRETGLDTELKPTFVQEYCNPVFEGIKSLCQWVKDQEKP